MIDRMCMIRLQERANDSERPSTSLLQLLDAGSQLYNHTHSLTSKHLSRLKTAYSTGNGALYKVSSTPVHAKKKDINGLLLQVFYPFGYPTQCQLRPFYSHPQQLPCAVTDPPPLSHLSASTEPSFYQIAPTDKVVKVR